MVREQLNWPANTERPPVAHAPAPRSGRALAIATAIVFCISSAFPAIAAFVTDTDSWPKWWGVLDVGIAFFLALLALAMVGLAHGKVNKEADDASYRAYRILTHGILAVVVIFFVVGDGIVWSNCLTGFAWRTWLLLYSLPAWFTMMRAVGDRMKSEPKQSLQPAGSPSLVCQRQRSARRPGG